MKTSYIIGVKYQYNPGPEHPNIFAFSPLLESLNNDTHAIEWASEKNYPIIEKFDSESEAIEWYEGFYRVVENYVLEHNEARKNHLFKSNVVNPLDKEIVFLKLVEI